MRGESHEFTPFIQALKNVLITILCRHRKVNEALFTQKQSIMRFNNIYIVLYNFN